MSKMEMGNLFFGHSRGEYEVPCEDAWLDPLLELFDAIDAEKNLYGHGVEFVSDVFEVHRYWWGDCGCGHEEDADYAEFGKSQGDHVPSCGTLRPNFWYKPTDFQLRWYKYPLRDSYMNQNLSLPEFKEIIGKCAESLKK